MSLLRVMAILLLAMSIFICHCSGTRARAECSSPLGMESKAIKDEQITAMTWMYHDQPYSEPYRAHYSRLNHKKGGGGWCSADHEMYHSQYLEIDLKVNTKITAIATQGRAGGPEYVDQYGIVYKRDDDKEFREYTEEGRWKIFKGNNDSSTVAKRYFSRPIIARRIRVAPRGDQFAVYCMRMELYGCRWKKRIDGLVQYFSSLGGTMDGALNLNDYGYDGEVYPELKFLSHGLGQLTDDVYGTKEVKKGDRSDWVGFNVDHPVFTFIFRKPRSFVKISFHIFQHAPDIKLFKGVQIFIGTSKENYRMIRNYHTNSHKSNEDGIFKVSIKLNYAVGTHLRCRFTRAGNWMLVSEVDFVTEPGSYDSATKSSAKPNGKDTPTPDYKDAFSKEDEENKSRIRTLWPQALTLPPNLRGMNNIPGGNSGKEKKVMYRQSSTDSHPKGLSFPIIVSIVLGAIVIVVVMVVFIVRRIRHAQNREKRKEIQYGVSRSEGPKQTDLLTGNKVIVHTNGSAQYSAKLLEHGYCKDSMDRYSVDGKLQMI